MSISARARLLNPDAIEVEITLKMPVATWKKLREQLSDNAWPAWDVRRCIADVMEKTVNRIEATQEST